LTEGSKGMKCLESRNLEPRADCRWFVVYTCPHHERTVAGLPQGKGLEVFFPTYEGIRDWADRGKRLTTPLFPGYLFFANKIDRQLQAPCTPGVQFIVPTANVPAPLPNKEILQNRRLLESSLPVEPHPFLKEGDRIRIKAGPLAGLEGILSRKKDGLRLVLSVTMLGRSAAVGIDAHDVEPVTASRTFRDFLGVFSSQKAQPSRNDRVAGRP
jgi:transcription antitermination factor NusG